MNSVPHLSSAAEVPSISAQLDAAISEMDYDGQFDILLNFFPLPQQLRWLTAYKSASEAEPARRDQKRASVILSMWVSL